MTNTELAQVLYEAYGDKANWKNYAGLPMPTWNDLPDNIKSYWEAVVIKCKKLKL